MRHWRRHRRILALGAGIGLLAACDPTPPGPIATPSPTAEAPAPTPDPEGPHATPGEGARGGGTLRFAIREPDRILPGEATEPDELLVVDAVFDSLTAYASNLAVVPSAAESWEVDEEQRTWTFVLRERGTFHDEDRTPVTASDFAFAWSRAVAGEAAGFHLREVEGYDEVAAGQAQSLRGVQAIDQRTLEVTLTRPNARFHAVVAHPALGPLPSGRFEPDPEGFRAQPIGNGPFALAEARVPDQFLRLQRFSDWRNGAKAPLLDEVLFQVMDPDTAFLAFQQGRLHVSPLPEGAVAEAIERYGTSAEGYRGPGVLNGLTPVLYFLGFRLDAAPFDQVSLRRAVSLAIDRERIAEATLGGNMAVARSLVSPALPEGREDACEFCRHDPDEAAALREASGHDGQVTLWFNVDGGHRGVAEMVREDLLAAGFGPVVFRSPPFEDYLTALGEGQAELFRFGWRPEYPGADDVLRPLFSTERIGEHNFMRYSDPEVDALLDEARGSASAVRRLFLHRRAEDLILERDQAVVPLLFYRHQRVVSEEVGGFALNPLGYANLHSVSLRAVDGDG